MSCDSSIGGYFELELNNFNNYVFDVSLNSGRASLYLLLKSIKPQKVFLPYYTCDVVREPIGRLDIECVFYKINQEFQPLIDDQKIDEDSVVIVNNYFGILDSRMRDYYTRFGDKLIIDNSQAFFYQPDFNTNAFYSPRKFMGLPDGGFVKLNSNILINAQRIFSNLEVSCSHHLMEHLYKRIDLGAESAYSLFKENDEKLSKEGYKKMSKLTYSLFQNADLDRIKNIRNENFKLIHEQLNSTNKLSSLINSMEYKCPMVYPYLNNESKSLKKKLIENRVYVATYWPNVKDWLKDNNSTEMFFFENLLALPIDQRLSEEDINYICELIQN